MLRLLRNRVLMSVVALAFVGCGGGGDKPPANDGGTADKPSVQFDGPQKDSGGTQQDSGGTQQDGSSGTCTDQCNASGGQPLNGWCKCTSDCNCAGTPSNACSNPWPDENVAGTCLKSCTGQQGECGNDICLGISQTLGVCVPMGTLSGTFSVKLQQNPQDLGNVNVQLQVADVNVSFGVGIARKITSQGKTYYVVTLIAGTAQAPDLDKQLSIIIPEADYSAKTWDLSDPQTQALIQYEVSTASGQTITSDTLTAFAVGGTLTLSKAGTADQSEVAGSITNGEVVKLLVEFCGPHSGPC